MSPIRVSFYAAPMLFRRQDRITTALFSALVLGMLLVGCRREPASGGDPAASNPAAPATYGLPKNSPTQRVDQVRTSVSTNVSIPESTFHVLQTELSPATLVHSSSRQLNLFSDLTRRGLAAPTHVAWATPAGPRTFKRGEKLEGTNMVECWVLVWWAGAVGWTNWDSPWVVYLQHRPSGMKLDDDGLHFDFPRQAGDVVMMPLYGYNKPPQEGHDYAAEHKLSGRKVKVKTWEWPKVLTRDPLTRIRYWACATREFPIRCEESFSVDRAKDGVTIRSHISRHSIVDDWKTRRIKLAPISPALAHALTVGGFPVRISERWFDLDLPTPHGPCLAIEGVDEYDATFPVLQYVNETEAPAVLNANAPASIKAALEKLQVLAQSIPGTRTNFHEAVANAGLWARALPYLDAPARSNALPILRHLFRDEVLAVEVLANNQVTPSSRSEHLLEPLWAYAHFTGDWELIRERWPLIRSFLKTQDNIRWAGYGSDGVVELGAQAAPTIAFARLAYQAGDMDSYHLGCQMLARELVVLFLKQRGADYFRQQQPWHSMEFMDETVFLTRLGSGVPGWDMDGPGYPAQSAERLFQRRWVGFHDTDVARFYRDHLRDDVHREISWLGDSAGAGRIMVNRSSDSPVSLTSLRSLLLNESSHQSSTMKTDEADEVSVCLSVLRLGGTPRFERLIPAGDASPFVALQERDQTNSPVAMLTSLMSEDVGLIGASAIAAWPELTWSAWKTPTGAPWSFGVIRPSSSPDKPSPRSTKTIALNWNTWLRVCDPAAE